MSEMGEQWSPKMPPAREAATKDEAGEARAGTAAEEVEAEGGGDPSNVPATVWNTLASGDTAKVVKWLDGGGSVEATTDPPSVHQGAEGATPIDRANTVRLFHQFQVVAGDLPWPDIVDVPVVVDEGVVAEPTDQERQLLDSVRVLG